MAESKKRGRLKWIVAVVILCAIAFLLMRMGSAGDKAPRRVRDARGKIRDMVAAFNALENWNRSFDEQGYKLDEGHRPIYTDDVQRALIETNKRPVLVTGRVIDVQERISGYAITLRYDGYPNLVFVLTTDEEQGQLVLRQDTDEGDLFAVVAEIKKVHRPRFEAGSSTWGKEQKLDAAGIVVEPGDFYVLEGKCLDLQYIWRGIKQTDPSDGTRSGTGE